jgi:LDH2 family malate/lactate/ureidoglycolate dehydrogenase
MINIYPVDPLRRWTSTAFRAVGIEANDADLTAEVLLRSNLRGIDTHGISRVPGYIEKIQSGEVNASANPSFSIRDGVLFFDGEGGLGQVVATKAVRQAVAQARDNSVVVCFVRNSGHLAALGSFVLEAAEAGMVGVLCQETPPLMALEGSAGPAIGNNPIAFACPVKDAPPLVFDMATSVVARGNVLQAISDGLPEIPIGWAIGPDGRPTRDPSAALRGAMLPIADYKGIGLAMLVQVLAGSLTGSRTAESSTMHGAKSSAGNISAFLMILNPERVTNPQTFDAHMRQWLNVYGSASGMGARYPGQRAAECEARRLVEGIPISRSTVKQLIKIGDLFGTPFDIAPDARSASAGDVSER